MPGQAETEKNPADVLKRQMKVFSDAMSLTVCLASGRLITMMS